MSLTVKMQVDEVRLSIFELVITLKILYSYKKPPFLDQVVYNVCTYRTEY